MEVRPAKAAQPGCSKLVTVEPGSYSPENSYKQILFQRQLRCTASIAALDLDSG